MLGSSIAILMVIEARRWARDVWFYIPVGSFIGIGGVPLFLDVRERRIVGADAPRINTFDSVLSNSVVPRPDSGFAVGDLQLEPLS